MTHEDLLVMPLAKPATERVTGYLRRQIERGELKPGDRLPPERELASRIGVSRPTVRSALRSLVAMRIVDSRHGFGTYMSDGPPTLDKAPLQMMASLHGFTRTQMLEARRVLEAGAAGLAATQATPEQIASIAAEVAGMYTSVDHPEAFQVHDARFHRAVAKASNNPILAALIDMVPVPCFEQHRQSDAGQRRLRAIAAKHRRTYLALRAAARGPVEPRLRDVTRGSGRTPAAYARSA